MSHDLDFTKGLPAIAYTGETPWHGFGQVMESDQPLERWIIEAGMDYSIIERPIAFTNNRHFDNAGDIVPDKDDTHPTFNTRKYTPVPGKKALCRSDTGDQLSVVSNRYKVVQPAAVMEFFRTLIADQGFKMHTAGVLAAGNRVWALAETGDEFTVNGQDRIASYLLLATAYDGKFSTTAQFTSVRVVCNNTLSFSLDRGENQASGIVRIPHTSEFVPQDVKSELGVLGSEGWVQFKDNVIQLSDYRVTKRVAVEFFLELLGVTEDEAAEGKQLLNAKKLLSFYESGPGSDFIGSKNTTWGLVNAVSFFTDHGRRAHSNGTRFDSASFGSGAKMKQQAFAAALALAA